MNQEQRDRLEELRGERAELVRLAELAGSDSDPQDDLDFFDEHFGPELRMLEQMK